MTITEAQTQLRAGKVSSLELTRSFLKTIGEKDKELHAFLTVDEEGALAAAKEADKKLAAGRAAPLCGIPYAVKDAIFVKGLRCTAGSRILENYVAPYDAGVIENLKEQGAVVLGKTNTDEFGMGNSTENSAYGPTRNPHDLQRVPGGSSGGSGAAVAAQEAVFALGEDTGGSVRLPASFCGVVGLRPTYGSVSRRGVMALASSLDQVGPFASTVEDCKAVFEAIRGRDVLDATSGEYPVNKSAKGKNLRVGVPKEFFGTGADGKVLSSVKEGIEAMERQGAKVVEVSLPNVRYALAAYYVLNMSEASANLARYDGIRYGKRRDEDTLLDVYEVSRGAGFGAEVKRRVMLGTYALSAGYYDAYYLKAQKARELVRRDFEKVFKRVDVVAGPVSPVVPFKIGEKEDPLSAYLVDVFTVPVSLAGLPAISVPGNPVECLPVGIQLIAKPFDEDTLFAAAALLEQ